MKEETSTQLPSLQRLALASRELLENPGPAKTHGEWTGLYRDCMQSAGLTYSPKRMDQQRLKKEFFHHHNEILCLMPHVSLGDGFAGDWLAQIVRKHRKAFHPLHHILFQDFLDQYGIRQTRFGQGPWLCQNPLSNHHGMPTIKAVRQHRNKGHWVGVFECVCGYTYTRSYFSATAMIGEPRFHSYGVLLEPEIRKLVKEQWSLRAISRRLELDPKTVIRLATELGIATPWSARNDVTPKPFAVAVETNSQTLSPKTTECARPPRQSKVDWEKLDANLCILVRSVAEQLKKQVPPVRVTTLQIERFLTGRGWISKRTEKLPKVMSCLTTVNESVTAFQQRRVIWIIQEMDLANDPLQVWKILRRAGLTMRNVGMVEHALIAHFFRRSAVA